MAAGPVMFGREREMRVIEQMHDSIGQRGGGLLIRGEAGVGKSFLMTAASALARQRGFEVLTTTGVQSEAHLPFAGLHQLLRPVLGRVDELPARQREALLGAFGMSDVAAPEFFFIALAALDLLADRAARSPLLLLAEDVQWLDRPTRDVLAFVARRLESEPTILLATIRTGYETALPMPELPELPIEALDDAASAALLDHRAPDLPGTVRARVLDEAAGNPLALVELPVGMRSGQSDDATLLLPAIPLTKRLERAFVARVGDLPDTTRQLLLVAAIDDDDNLDEVLRAGALLCHATVTDEALVPAVAATLVEFDDTSVRFRHPLVRSAIRQAAAGREQRAAHAALARVLAGQPDRSAWHRAAALSAPDEAVAADLEAAATRAARRGAITVAVASLERAAQLSAKPTHRGSRLLWAAEMAFQLGRPDLVMRLLREAQRLDLGPADTSRMLWLHEVFDDGDPEDSARISALVDAADRAVRDGDTDLALNLLRAVALRCFWDDADDDVTQRLVAAADHLRIPTDDPQLIGILSLAAPITRGPAIAERLSGIAPDAADPDSARLLGSSAFITGDCASAARFLAAAVDGLRARGQLGLLAQALVLNAWAALHLGAWNTAMAATDEGGRLASETAQPLWTVAAQVGAAMLAGLRGEQDLAATLADQSERLLQPKPVRALTGILRLARGQAALSDGRYEDAYQYLHTMFDPTNRAYHPVIRCWAVADLAEAAVRSGHRDAARATVEGMQPTATVTPSPLLRAGMLYARAVLADDEHAETLFKAGIATELTDWQFLHARLQLAYGSWLRRRRRVADARVPLRGARETLDALGAVQWAQRARDELRAAGESSHQAPNGVWNRISPQELQIAQMAADGMSNREIGQRLYLSHRTVGSHLYRIFPKLGITSRSQLRAALDDKTPSR